MSGSGTEQIIIVPPAQSALDNLPLLTDMQFGERHTSQALNRKGAGVVRPGVFRGFDCLPAGGLDLVISSANIAPKNGVAYIEYNNYSLTVFQQHDVTLTATEGDWYVVLEANYGWKVVTDQIDINSRVKAAEIKLISISDLAENQVILCRLTIPGGTSVVLEEHIDFTERPAGGHDFEGHSNHPNPHPQYQLKDEATAAAADFERKDNAAENADIDDKSNDLHHIKLPQLWRALVNWEAALKAQNNPFPQYWHNDEVASQNEAAAGSSNSVILTALRGMQQLESRISNALNGTRTNYAASEYALKQAYDKAVSGYNLANSKWTYTTATTSRYGAVKLSNALTGTSQYLAATEYAAKQIYDLASSKYTAAAATLSVAGLIKLASVAEAIEGKNATNAVTPNGLLAAIKDRISSNYSTGTSTEHALSENAGRMIWAQVQANANKINNNTTIANEALDKAKSKLKWEQVEAGSLDHGFLNQGMSKRGTVTTISFRPSNWQHATGRYMVVLSSTGIFETNNTGAAWWAAQTSEPYEVTRWTGGGYVSFDVYTAASGVYNTGSHTARIFEWRLYKLVSD